MTWLAPSTYTPIIDEQAARDAKAHRLMAIRCLSRKNGKKKAAEHVLAAELLEARSGPPGEVTEEQRDRNARMRTRQEWRDKRFIDNYVRLGVLPREKFT